MKKFWLLGIMAAFVMGSAASMTSCDMIIERFTYDDAKKYSVGEASIAQSVTDLEIDWLTGSVNVVYGDVEHVSFSESAEESLTEAYTVHYWLENTTLHVKYAESGIQLTNVDVPDKDLVVTLPAALALNTLEIDSVAAKITLTDIKANEVEIDNISGNVEASFASVREFSIDGVSGNANLRFATAPIEGEYHNVSGDITVYLPEDTGFTAEVEKLNGGFQSDFETVKRGNEYICGSGANRYEFEMVSGKVSILKLTNGNA